jgi:hypothetical protein
MKRRERLQFFCYLIVRVSRFEPGIPSLIIQSDHKLQAVAFPHYLKVELTVVQPECSSEETNEVGSAADIPSVNALL